jgi:hypothetical protein
MTKHDADPQKKNKIRNVSVLVSEASRTVFLFQPAIRWLFKISLFTVTWLSVSATELINHLCFFIDT